MKKFDKQFVEINKAINGPLGFMIDSMPTEIREELDKEVKNIQNNFEASKPYNDFLVGQIDKEYELWLPPKTTEYIKEVISNYIQVSNLESYYRSLFGGGDFKLNKELFTWVNFQQKYEYNPPHFHTGLISYVIWHKIPYTYEDECKYGPGKKQNSYHDPTVNYADSHRIYNGCFAFYSPGVGNLLEEVLEVDNSWEGTLCVFPASLSHAVFPFYTSDEYRITIAGNINLGY